MGRVDSRDRREPKAGTATKAPMDIQDTRENQANPAPRDPLPIRLIPRWPKVSEGTQDSQELTGSQEAGVSQGTQVSQAPQAPPASPP